MLKSLTINNVALIDHTEITFSDGLNVLSGETGAGKSVILDSIDFVLGAKADRNMIRFGQNECSVRAEFFSDDENIAQSLMELDIDVDDTLIISRKLNLDGKSSIKINGCSVSSGMLKKITANLVDVHGQSEHFYLLKESNQLKLLDKIAGLAPQKETVAQLLAKKKALLLRLADLGGDDAERMRRIDILNYQIDELERASLSSEEEEQLLALRNKYSNAERIGNGLNTAHSCLLDDGTGCDCVNTAVHALNSIVRYGEYQSIAERLENALAELQDVGETIEGYLDEIDIDEQEVERVENRLDEIKTLKKKYGGSVETALQFLEQATEERSALLNSEEECERLKNQIQTVTHELYQCCCKLTEARKRAAESFTARVTAELKTLNIASAKFEVKFDEYTEDDSDKITSDGLGCVRFLFSANAGEPLKELGKIISGGEMSRFMLAIKTQLSSIGSIGTYIFDEIDAGIGGKTARVIAEKFCTISRKTQIIAVSHLAQIASFADKEFLIEKKEEDGRTYSRIREVLGDERRSELARLISGEESELALQHADELLKFAEQMKKSVS